MLIDSVHLSYCTNIHAGDDWDEHLRALQDNIPLIKKQLAPNQPFGIGLRISNRASQDLQSEEVFQAFQTWLRKNDVYVFTVNGFPYGEFHNEAVKENVHAPDWTTTDRLFYTLRLIGLLAKLLPKDVDGGISTSPLGYRHWFATETEKKKAMQTATMNIIQVVEQLSRIKSISNKILHLDIEPEPDGLLETGDEFLEWYRDYLIPLGREHFRSKFNKDGEQSDALIKEHVRLCYDVCHFALGYENHEKMIEKLEYQGISIGKFQISAALKANLSDGLSERTETIKAFAEFNESTYLHQVIAKKTDGKLLRYRDLPEAITDAQNPDTREWRAHFHVPVFLSKYELLQSTQSDIVKVLNLQRKKRRTPHVEVETYTWNVLPRKLKLPMHESITRELQWVKNELTK